MTPRTFVKRLFTVVGVQASACPSQPKGGTPADISNRPRFRNVPHGVTVLEVIFSIGIVAVGLLGTLTIIPVAANRVTQGTIADNADRAGRNAIRQFDVGQMRRPDLWMGFNTSSNPQQYISFRGNNAHKIRRPAFCIDPLFISTHVWNANNSGTRVSQRTEYFPYFVPLTNEARMWRITLGNYYDDPSAPGIGRKALRAYSVERAYQVFMTQDDLVFDLPDEPDRTLFPKQKFDSSNAKRQFEGKYTWMVTVSPKGMHYSSSALNSAPSTDLYTLSFIVLHRRDMSMEMHYADPKNEGPDPERLVDVDFRWKLAAPSTPPSPGDPLAPGAGIGGGNAWFKSMKQDRNGNGNPQDDPHWPQDLEVRRGDWVMLSARVQPNNNNNLAHVSVFRWYRVLSADDVSGDATNGYARTVSLLGPDWTDVITAQLEANAAPVARATLLNGAVAVYEKTIRLETSGMWTNL